MTVEFAFEVCHQILNWGFKSWILEFKFRTSCFKSEFGGYSLGLCAQFSVVSIFGTWVNILDLVFDVSIGGLDLGFGNGVIIYGVDLNLALTFWISFASLSGWEATLDFGIDFLICGLKFGFGVELHMLASGFKSKIWFGNQALVLKFKICA